MGKVGFTVNCPGRASFRSCLCRVKGAGWPAAAPFAEEGKKETAACRNAALLLQPSPRPSASRLPAGCSRKICEWVSAAERGRERSGTSEYLQTVFQKFDLDKGRITRFASISLKEKGGWYPGAGICGKGALPYVYRTGAGKRFLGSLEASGSSGKRWGVDKCLRTGGGSGKRRRKAPYCPGRRPGALP